jgi:hypothetical protein
MSTLKFTVQKSGRLNEDGIQILKIAVFLSTVEAVVKAETAISTRILFHKIPDIHVN